MKKYTYNILTALLITISFLGIAVTSSNAQTVKGLAIKPIYSSNQIQQNGYLNPKVKPGSKQDLSFSIINFSDKTQKLKISANTAATSGAPGINYSSHKFLNDNDKKLNFNQLFDKSVITKKVKPYKATKVTFKANIPKDNFKGIIFGGFYIDNNLELNTKQGSTVVNNRYTYVMPAILQTTTQNNILPKLSLGTVDAENINTEPRVNATIHNSKPTAIYNLDLKTNVWNDKKKKVVDESTTQNTVAPNTHFTMKNNTNQDQLNPGKYHIKIVANSDQGKWVMEKDFTISNTQYLGSYLQANSWLIYLIIILILLLLLLIAYLIYRKYKKNQEKKEQQNI